MLKNVARFYIYCDFMRYDSAAIKAGFTMASVVHSSMGCHVQGGPYDSGRAAEESSEAIGWWLTHKYGVDLAYCPVHRNKAESFWADGRDIA